MKLYCLIVIIYSCCARGQLHDLINAESNFELQRINMIVDIITLNLKKNGWSTIICFGNFPDELYVKLQNIFYPRALTNIDREDEDLEDVVRYYANTIIVNLLDIEAYESTILKLRDSPYWHPHSNIIFYYHENDPEILAKIYFSLWYYRAINVVIVQYDDNQEVLLVSHYTPYISDYYELDHLYGCWTTRKIGIPVSGFDEGFTCVQKCHNITSTQKLRANNLGTCIGFSIHTVPYNDTEIITTLNLFEEKGKNLHGFKLRVFTIEVIPFLIIEDHGNGSYTLGSRDGKIWNSMAKLMNFRLDLSPSADDMKRQFNFERNINQLFDFAFRKADLYLGPIYLFDVAVIEVDYSFPYKESGACIIAHRAEFEIMLFDEKKIQANQNNIIQFVLCFFGVWATFAFYKGVERGSFSYDQFGKDFLNALRNVLLITLCHPPKQQNFRLFLTIFIWSFFVLNFANQATIISLLTAAKRGKEVDTFEDMIEKGYNIYGVSSPDLILPETEEKFRIINSRMVPVQDLYECVRDISFDKHRFCLIDCSIGRYLERNRLNEEGEQYLHVAQKDRMHSHYLTILFSKHSPLTEYFDKHVVTFFEAGLIKKWESYRYAAIKEEPLTKPLGMDDMKSLFNVYCLSLAFLFLIFLLELFVFYAKTFFRCCFKTQNKLSV